MSFADDLVAAFQPWSTPEHDDYLRTLGEMFHEVEFYAEDTDEDDGWTILFDPNRMLYKDLRWLGQVVGERIPVAHPEALMREWIADRVNNKRGTLDSVLRAAQRHLTGTRMVTWQEKTSNINSVGTDVDGFLVITYADQTPYPDQTRQDILSALPGDIVLTYLVHDGQRWQEVKTGHPTWADTKADYATWSLGKTTDVPIAGNSFSRPMPT